MPERRLRWGILSTANIGRAAVIPAIQASAGGEVVAVASRDAGKGAAFAAKLGIPRSYGSYDALLEDDGIDAVYIPLPNSLHREWALRAVAAGKHVLCEKPLGLSAAECIEMGEAARAAGVQLHEAFMYRFHPQTETARRLLQDGAIGEVRHLHAAFTFRLTNAANIRFQPDLGGGALLDVGCYCVDAMRTVAGQEPVEVQAWAVWHPTGVDEQMAGTLRFAGGTTGQFDCAITLARRETFLAAGTEGTLELPHAYLPGEGDTRVVVRRGRGEPETHTIPGTDEYRLMAEHFATCVLDDAPLRYDAWDAARTLRVLEALARSARDGGRPVAVEPLQ